MVPNLTFDTSCVISLIGKDETPVDELAALRRMLLWNKQGKLNIWVSGKSRTEAMENIDDGKSVKFWLEALAALSAFNSAKGGWIAGMSRIGVDTRAVSDSLALVYYEIKKILTSKKTMPKKIRGGVFDTGILLDHLIHGNELFVSRDKEHLALVNHLQKPHHILICSPVGALKNFAGELSNRLITTMECLTSIDPLPKKLQDSWRILQNKRESVLHMADGLLKR